MDLVEKYFHGNSPYIHSFIYDLERREVSLICYNNIEDKISTRQLLFSNVQRFTEQQFEDVDDESLVDSIMGIHLLSDYEFCVNTEKRELTIVVGSDPTSRDI